MAYGCVNCLTLVAIPCLLQVVRGRVMAADKRTVLVDVGYRGFQRFFRSELHDAPIYTEDGVNRGIPTELMVRCQQLCASFRVTIVTSFIRISHAPGIWLGNRA